jgi:hypothetical protein
MKMGSCACYTPAALQQRHFTTCKLILALDHKHCSVTALDGIENGGRCSAHPTSLTAHEIRTPVAEFDGDWRSKVLFPHNNKLVVIHELGEELCFRNSLRLHVPGIKS